MPPVGTGNTSAATAAAAWPPMPIGLALGICFGAPPYLLLVVLVGYWLRLLIKRQHQPIPLAPYVAPTFADHLDLARLPRTHD
ncbi:hypothetical protein N8T08_001964 [Aspergillus melleus]|uniref:Uncharacterized protein n=1 Tax=Aspergillus melleus TaxID=138277 RepID=A0ACC3BA28_9EURO|nr:hypothetical protein N8T08_001964 [Aspergillus melleus]